MIRHVGKSVRLVMCHTLLLMWRKYVSGEVVWRGHETELRMARERRTKSDSTTNPRQRASAQHKPSRRSRTERGLSRLLLMCVRICKYLAIFGGCSDATRVIKLSWLGQIFDRKLRETDRNRGFSACKHTSCLQSWYRNFGRRDSSNLRYAGRNDANPLRRW
jgi:hypothetical protein